jgi:hypothetical protein
VQALWRDQGQEGEVVMKILLFCLLTVATTICIHLVVYQGVPGWHVLAGASYGFILKWFNEPWT